jgi:hypothetical protein
MLSGTRATTAVFAVIAYSSSEFMVISGTRKRSLNAGPFDEGQFSAPPVCTLLGNSGAKRGLCYALVGEDTEFEVLLCDR